jgi:hypothetical protein
LPKGDEFRGATPDRLIESSTRHEVVADDSDQFLDVRVAVVPKFHTVG